MVAAGDIASEVRGSRRMLVLSFCPPFYSVGSLAQGMVLMSPEIGLLSSTYPIWKLPHRHVQGFVSKDTLAPVKRMTGGSERLQDTQLVELSQVVPPCHHMNRQHSNGIHLTSHVQLLTGFGSACKLCPFPGGPGWPPYVLQLQLGA